MSSLAQRTHVRDRTHGRGAVMAALDIGSSKITCMINMDMIGRPREGRVIVGGAGNNRGAVMGAFLIWAAWTASWMVRPWPMMESWVPGRRTLAWPRGTRWSPSGTSQDSP